MDCNIFKKRLNDLLEDNLSYDLREAMLDHIKGCEFCAELYKEELEIDEMFKTGLTVDIVNFRSLRSDIMKNINKNRYGISSIKRLFNHFKKNIVTYTSFAAIIAVIIFLVPYVKSHGLLGMNKSAGMSPQNITTQNATMSLKSANTSDNVLGIANDANNKQTGSGIADGNIQATSKIGDSYIPQFEKKQLNKEYNVKYNTPWEVSLNKKFSATVEGKGTEAQEEGIGNIILKDLDNGNLWSFNLINNEIQYSPKAVKWIDDENLLVIVGFGYGTVNQGGKVYMININKDIAAKADPQNTANLNDLSEITKIQSVKMIGTSLNIGVEVLAYEDNQKNNNHRENRTITSPFNEIVKMLK